MRLENKVAVITGGASGIGLATVWRFLEEGASVVVADFNESNGLEVVKQATDNGQADRISFIKTDVAQEADVIAMIEEASARFGRLDVVFNNAGVGGAIGSLTETTTEDWDYTFDVVAKGVFLGIKHAARIMIAQNEGGSIINTASMAALSGEAGPPVYSAAKAAVVNLTKSAAVDFGQYRIRVNSICPGFILTPLADGGKPEKTQEKAKTIQPWPDYGKPDHIAATALFLASEDSEFITGESIVVDGGLTAVGPEMSKRFPGTSGRVSGIAGVTKGSTGEPPVIRKLEDS